MSDIPLVIREKIREIIQAAGYDPNEVVRIKIGPEFISFEVYPNGSLDPLFITRPYS